jgi:hypothetical protein
VQLKNATHCHHSSYCNNNQEDNLEDGVLVLEHLEADLIAAGQWHSNLIFTTSIASWEHATCDSSLGSQEFRTGKLLVARGKKIR